MKETFTAVARMLAAGVLTAVAAPAAGQQVYPNKPIRLIVPYPPGGSNSNVARLIAPKLAESWGQQVLVDNRGGGNTIIGTEALVKSPPDGYTLLLAAGTHVITPLLIPTPYDPIKDFAAVATVSSTELVLVVHPSVPANNLQEFIALARSRPGQLNYGTSGSGSATHLAIESFNILAGVKMQQIPYKGSGPALIDLIGGQVQVYFTPPVNVVPHIKSGKLRAIAVSGENRVAALPQLPTFTQAGLPNLDVKGWYAVIGPAGIPKDVINRLATEIARIMLTPEMKERLAGQGMDAFISTPEQLAELMKADMARYAKIIKTANIRI